MTISTESFLSINVGSSANDGTGDDLRTAFQKVNANFGWVGNTGFNAANIAATSIETTGNITTSAYLLGNGALITGIVSTYGNVQVGEYLSEYVGNIAAPTITGNIIVENAYVPASNTSPGTAGQIVWDSGNIYVCVATDTWMRASLTDSF